MGKYSLSKTEQEIMNVLWENPEFYTTKELLDLFNLRGKDWKRQTLNTLLVRLENKNIIRRDGKKVIALCSEIEYKQMQCTDILNSKYQGSICNFVSELTGKKQISKEDETELNRFIEKLNSK